MYSTTVIRMFRDKLLSKSSDIIIIVINNSQTTPIIIGPSISYACLTYLAINRFQCGFNYTI